MAIWMFLQMMAGAFLVMAGWALAGDYLAWLKVHHPDYGSGRRYLTALVFFLIYFAALMLYRYGPIHP